MKQREDKALQFVVNHYREHRLDGRRAWCLFREKHPDMATLQGYSMRFRWVAAVACVFVAVIVVAWGAYYVGHHSPSPTPRVSPYEQNTDSGRHTTDTLTVFRYNHTPINRVLQDLSNHYGVSLSVNDTTQCVTGEIEAVSLPEVIDILETTLNVKVQQP